MAKEQTATFIGHKECYGVSSEQVREEIIKLIENGVTDFLSGGMGSFDWMCARIVFELKKTYHHIHNYLVIPYLTFTILEDKYFDTNGGRVSIKKIYDLLKAAPYGFMPCNLTAFILGFVLKEYATGTYSRSDGLTNDILNVAKLKEMVDEVIRLESPQILVTRISTLLL